MTPLLDQSDHMVQSHDLQCREQLYSAELRYVGVLTLACLARVHSMLHDACRDMKDTKQTDYWYTEP